jgi:hypothetical protein
MIMKRSFPFSKKGKSLFEIVLTVTVQNVFYLKIHQNKVFFYFFKLILILLHQNDLKILKNILI